MILRKEGVLHIELPGDLRYALETELAAISPKKLAKTATELSDRYRVGKLPVRKSYIESQEDVYAYAAFRMPATFAAVYSALKQVSEVLPDWNPQTLLDVGTGPGTVMWAADAVYPDINAINLLEKDEHMIDLGRKLAEHASSIPIQKAEWIKADVTGHWETSPHDMVTASYVLGELSEQNRNALLKKLWHLAKDTLVIIEPGTPAGFSRIKQARELLIAEGGISIAPCPHNSSCPMAEDDWCHFSQRLSRSRLHRQIKAGELSYEDEKFSFIAVSRRKGEAVSGRVLRHPQIRKGHIEFEVCSHEGISKRVITRKDKELFRKARKLSWGSVFPQSE